MYQRLSGILLLLGILVAFPKSESSVFAQSSIRDIEFGVVDGVSLKLDLHLPPDAEETPLLVWIHGGAWRRGAKESVPVKKLVEERGWAVASIGYRLSPVAKFPAQIHDIKAAIRFLRANAHKYGYESNRIAIAGASAGGHLAALVGVTNEHQELEGTIGEHLDQSSSVQATVSLYGASNLTTILNQSTPHGLSVREPALDLFIGGHPDRVPDVAKLASPVFHVDKSDPPLLLIHGDQDPQMPINQAHELHGKFKSLELKVEFDVLHGAAHGGERFYTTPQIVRIDQFLRRHLSMQKATEFNSNATGRTH